MIFSYKNDVLFLKVNIDFKEEVKVKKLVLNLPVIFFYVIKHSLLRESIEDFLRLLS